MNDRFGKLDDALTEAGVAGYLLDSDGTNANQRYLAAFHAPDDYLTLYHEGDINLLVRGLERSRAVRESRANSVQTPADYDFDMLLDDLGVYRAEIEVSRRFLADFEIDSVLVPHQFPIGRAEGLREGGITVKIDETDVINEIRAIKSADEIDAIRRAQRATERAMATAESMLAEAAISEDRILTVAGEPLTSERVRSEISHSLLDDGCVATNTIVAGGSQAADPHDRGCGPLRANEPIVIDIFPVDERSGYHADMTRTLAVGEVSKQFQRWYELILDAQQAAFNVLEPGVTGKTVHEAVCAVLEDDGLPTAGTDPSTAIGFTHGTGHGVGLDVHESPRLSTTGTSPLQAGHVVTVEPGLYDPAVGGIRIEDLVVITDSGYENLTQYDKKLVI